MLFGTEGAFSFAINCYDAEWTGHLELKISVMWHRIESSKRGSSEQCMIAAAKRDDIKDQLFVTVIIRGSEDYLQIDGACTAGLHAWYNTFEGGFSGFDL